MPEPRLALELAESPNRFLSTVQIGITLIGVVAGVFGGATLAEDLAGWLAVAPVLQVYSQQLALVLVVGAITFLSLVVGELAPKRIGLGYAEFIACRRPASWQRLSRLVHPLVRVLSWSTDSLLRCSRCARSRRKTVSEDEIKGLMREGLRAGAFNRVESEMVSNVLDLDRLVVRDIMTPRPKIIWLSKDDTHEKHLAQDRGQPALAVPGLRGIARQRGGGGVGEGHLRQPGRRRARASGRFDDPPLIVPETQPVPKLLDSFRQTGTHVALASNEFGTIVGMVTLIDVMEAVVGELPSQDDRLKPDIRLRPDGTWLADALVDIGRAEEVLAALRPMMRRSAITKRWPASWPSAWAACRGRATWCRPSVTCLRSSTWTCTGWTRYWSRALPPRWMWIKNRTANAWRPAPAARRGPALPW
jgi:putative hemolysin